MTARPAPALSLVLLTALLTTAAAAEPSRQELRILSEASTVVDQIVAAPEVQLQAQILSCSRSRGLFAGLSLEGAALEPREEANERLYGEPASARSILVRHERTVPTAASAFVRTIHEDSAR